jgi:hypothetical protein
VWSHFFWNQFATVKTLIFVLFAIYTTGAELGALFGEGEILRIFLRHGSSQVQLMSLNQIGVRMQKTGSQKMTRRDLSVGGNRQMSFVPKPPPLSGGHRP